MGFEDTIINTIDGWVLTVEKNKFLAVVITIAVIGFLIYNFYINRVI
jgi:hypothetical protein